MNSEWMVYYADARVRSIKCTFFSVIYGSLLILQTGTWSIRPINDWWKSTSPDEIWHEFFQMEFGESGRTPSATGMSALMGNYMFWKIALLQDKEFYALLFSVKPRFKIRPANTTAYEGYPVMLNCVAIGDPTPTIQWDKNSKVNAFDLRRFKVRKPFMIMVLFSR